MTAITFLNRSGFILLAGRFELPPWLRRGLRYVPAAAITSVVAPTLLLDHGSLDLTPGNLRLLAGAAAALVACRSGSPVATIAVGMLTLYALQAWSD